jgi:hypothetical protein
MLIEMRLVLDIACLASMQKLSVETPSIGKSKVPTTVVLNKSYDAVLRLM